MSNPSEILREALADLVEIIDAAGLANLSNGVQLGPTAWYVKATDCMAYARRALEGRPSLEMAPKISDAEHALWEDVAPSVLMDLEHQSRAQAGAVQRPAGEECAWHEDEDGLWQMGCGGDPWLFESGGAVENRVTFCMHCGARVRITEPSTRKGSCE